MRLSPLIKMELCALQPAAHVYVYVRAQWKERKQGGEISAVSVFVYIFL